MLDSMFRMYNILMPKQGGCYNPSGMRWVSDQVDKVLPRGNPVRQHIHGHWHQLAGGYAMLTGNPEQARIEFNRAESKFNSSETNKLMRQASLEKYKYGY